MNKAQKVFLKRMEAKKHLYDHDVYKRVVKVGLEKRRTNDVPKTN